MVGVVWDIGLGGWRASKYVNSPREQLVCELINVKICNGGYRYLCVTLLACCRAPLDVVDAGFDKSPTCPSHRPLVYIHPLLFLPPPSLTLKHPLSKPVASTIKHYPTYPDTRQQPASTMSYDPPRRGSRGGYGPARASHWGQNPYGQDAYGQSSYG